MVPEIQPTRELVDQIVFGMENQEEQFFLDLEGNRVVREGHVPPAERGERYVELPPWKPVDGYNLMMRFVSGLRNPVYRERLRVILASGRGVFRQFKDALSERDDIERLWLGFKQREMRHTVTDWLNDLRELQGLERLELTEEEDPAPLVASDFGFSDGTAAHIRTIRELDRRVFTENVGNAPSGVATALYRRSRTGLPEPGQPGSTVLVAETPEGDPVAYLWAVEIHENPCSVSIVLLLYVIPDYRGIGLADALLGEHMRRCSARGTTDVVVELTGDAAGLERALTDRGLRRTSASLRISVRAWNGDVTGQ